MTVAGTALTHSQLPYTNYYESGSSLTYTYASGVASTSAPATVGYFWSSTSGLSQTLRTNSFTVSATGTVTGAFTATTFGIDKSSTNYANSGTTVSVTLTNCAANDLIIVMGSVHSNTVTGVTDNLGSHLSWAQRDTVDSSGHQRISEWWATYSAGGTITITVTFPSDTYLSVVAFAISGANTATPFDTHTGVPYLASSGSVSAPSVTGVSTTNPNDLIIGFEGSRSATTETASGTGFSLIGTAVSAAGNGAAESAVVTSALNGATVSFGTSTSNDWL